MLDMRQEIGEQSGFKCLIYPSKASQKDLQEHVSHSGGWVYRDSKGKETLFITCR